MRFVIAIILACAWALAASAQTTPKTAISPGFRPPPPPAPSTIAPRPPNEIAPPREVSGPVPPRQVDDAMSAVCPPGQKSCAPGSPAR